MFLLAIAVVLSRNLLQNVAEGFEPQNLSGQTFGKEECLSPGDSGSADLAVVVVRIRPSRPRTWAGLTTITGLERPTTVVSATWRSRNMLVCKGTCNLQPAQPLPFCVLALRAVLDAHAPRAQIHTVRRKIGEIGEVVSKLTHVLVRPTTCVAQFQARWGSTQRSRSAVQLTRQREKFWESENLGGNCLKNP